MQRFALILLAGAVLASPAKAQGIFDPTTVAYVLCVTQGLRALALEHPPLAKDQVIEQAFGACHDTDSEIRKTLLERGVSPHEIGERLATIKKFIRQHAWDDIDRYRANRARPR